MLQKDVRKRMKLSDILKSNWVTNNGRVVIKIDEISIADIQQLSHMNDQDCATSKKSSF